MAQRFGGRWYQRSPSLSPFARAGDFQPTRGGFGGVGVGGARPTGRVGAPAGGGGMLGGLGGAGALAQRPGVGAPKGFGAPAPGGKSLLGALGLGLGGAIAGSLLGGGSEPAQQTTDWGLAPYDPGALGAWAGQIGYSPAQYGPGGPQVSQPITPTGPGDLGDWAAASPAGLLSPGQTQVTSEGDQLPGYQYQDFGGQQFMRPEGAGPLPTYMQDWMNVQRQQALGRYGQAAGRAAGGGTSSAIGRRLATMEQEALLNQAMAGGQYERDVLGQITGMVNRPVTTGGTQAAAVPSLGAGIGGIMGNLANFQMMQNLLGGGGGGGANIAPQMMPQTGQQIDPLTGQYYGTEGIPF